MSSVSVIVTTYNRGHLLEAAVRSVLEQTAQDLEIIVMDDGSRDNTSEVVRSIPDPRIRYLRNATNRGVAASRNRGIQNARGDHIAFLDDDDRWVPSKIEAQLRVLGSAPPEVGGVYSGYLEVDADDRVVGRECPSAQGDLLAPLLLRNGIATSSVLLKRECLEAVGGFDPTVPYCDDHDLWIRVAEKYRWACLSEPLVRYRTHEVQLTNNLSLVIAGKERMLEKYDAQLASQPAIHCKRRLELAVLYCLGGDTRKGRALCTEAFRSHPGELRALAILLASIGGKPGFQIAVGLSARLTRVRRWLGETARVAAPD